MNNGKMPAHPKDGGVKKPSSIPAGCGPTKLKSNSATVKNVKQSLK